MIHNEDEWGKKVLTKGRDEKHKGIKKIKKEQWVAEASYLLFHAACQLCKRDKIAFCLLSSTVAAAPPYPPTLPAPPLYYFCWYNSLKRHLQREREREHMARCIIEQCQRLRLETASAAIAPLPAGGASKDRKVICHWHNGQTRCHYTPWVWTQFSAPSAAKGSSESEDGERKKGGKDWIYAGALSLGEIHRSVRDGLFCHLL